MARRNIVRLGVFLAAVVLAPVPVRAQSNPPTDIATSTIVTAYGKSASKVASDPSLSNLTPSYNFNTFDLAGAISSALVVETAGFPIGSSSGGFTYSFDPTSGAATRTSPSFGPAFAERALTSGRGKLDIGFTYLHRSFDKVEGNNLDDGSVKYSAPLDFVDPVSHLPTGTADLIESSFRLKLRSDTAIFYATYGVLDKLDVSLAVPVQHVSIEADVHSQLTRFGPTSTTPLKVPAADDSESKDASGIGDIAVRAKYNVFKSGPTAVAGGLDLRLPTGNDVDLLGTGRVRTKIYAAASSSWGHLFPHANLGYTFKSKASADHLFFWGPEVSYAFGAEYVMNPRITVVGDISGRSLADEGRLQDQVVPHDLVGVIVGGTLVQPTTVNVTELHLIEGKRLNTTLASIGAKFNPGSTFIISGHLLFRLNNAGLRANVTPVIGVDYTF